MMMNMTMPKDYFVFSGHITHFLLENLHIDTTTGIVVACLVFSVFTILLECTKALMLYLQLCIVVACLVVGVFTILLECTKALMLYLQLRLKQNPLTYGQTSTSIQSDRMCSFCNKLQFVYIPGMLFVVGQQFSAEMVRRKLIQYHVGGYFLHTINLTLGYLIMLAVMTFNAYILIAVIIGSGCGFYIFGAVSKWNQAKFAALSSKVYERYDSQVEFANQHSMEGVQ